MTLKSRAYAELEEAPSLHIPENFPGSLQEGLVNLQTTNLVLQLFYLLTSELDTYRPTARRKNHKTLTHLKSILFFS